MEQALGAPQSTRVGSSMDFELTDEQRLISETAREFADNEIVPRVRENDRAARFDRELASKLGEVGYLGAPVAEEYGGRGLDYIGYGLIVEEVGRADSSARTVVSVQTSLVAGSIERWGTEEQKQQLAAAALLGRGARLLRPDRARHRLRRRQPAHPRQPKTDSGWSISGQKMWISLGNFSEVALIFAQTDPEKKHRGPRLLPRPDRQRGLHRPRRSTASSACAPPTPPRSRSTRSRSATTRCSARSATASRSR